LVDSGQKQQNATTDEEQNRSTYNRQPHAICHKRPSKTLKNRLDIEDG